MVDRPIEYNWNVHNRRSSLLVTRCKVDAMQSMWFDSQKAHWSIKHHCRFFSKFTQGCRTKLPSQLSTADTVELCANMRLEVFLQPMQRAFMNLRGFYPFAPSYNNQNLAVTMKSIEGKKETKIHRENFEQGILHHLHFHQAEECVKKPKDSTSDCLSSKIKRMYPCLKHQLV